MSQAAQPEATSGANEPKGSLISKIAEGVRDWKEILLAMSALLAAMLTAYNFFITRSEFENVNCRIHRLLEINSLELREKKLADIQSDNSREIVHLQTLSKPNQRELERLRQFEISLKSATESLDSARTELEQLRNDALRYECRAT